ncbi:MAG: alpha/beta hydrolase [Nannocystaceae bacterium]|nr:alpha/beta hydrolase [Deltaproteobacteria bacterium]MBP7291631.1 alpha/beta hydrolase [Nannocystaceae bacterium]
MLARASGWLFLLANLAGVAFTLNAFLPVRRRTLLVIPSFLLSMFAAELAVHHLFWQLLATACFAWLGALGTTPGLIGLGLAVVSWLGLAVLVIEGPGSGRTIREALAQLGPPSTPRRPQWWRVAVPFPLRRAGTRVTRNVEFARVGGTRLRLDVYRPLAAPGLRPALVQIHGGGWVVGDKREQGVPIMTRMSDRGWVGFNVNYRLSPGATWPDHLVDIKRAIGWIREHAAEYGVDPGFIAVTGGSAGGHLAAMAALTANDPSLQPGFEHADTRLQAAVPFYAIYDFTNRLHSHVPGFLERLLEPLVMKAFYADAPERFAAASPLDRVHADAPPFFVIHGRRDTLAPLVDAQAFVAALRQVSRAQVLFAEVAGAQHAFDVFLSPRSLPVIEGVGDFLEHVWQDAVQARAATREGEPAAPDDQTATSPGADAHAPP